jgi:hypothetical protein
MATNKKELAGTAERSKEVLDALDRALRHMTKAQFDVDELSEAVRAGDVKVKDARDKDDLEDLIYGLWCRTEDARECAVEIAAAALGLDSEQAQKLEMKAFNRSAKRAGEWKDRECEADEEEDELVEALPTPAKTRGKRKAQSTSTIRRSRKAATAQTA